MRQVVAFFMCVFIVVLAACSPKHFSGERVARTSMSSDSCDSTAMRRWLDHAVRESMEKHMEKSVIFETLTIREAYSAPDSTGAQHVTERSTTRTQGGSVSSYGSVSSREDERVERTDSTSVSSSHGEAMTEEKEKITGKVSGWLPWYVYLVCVVGAAIVGIGLAMRGKKWFSSKD